MFLRILNFWDSTEINLKSKIVKIGRRDSNDIILDDTSVSREQCILYIEKGNWVLKDIGSFFGTIILREDGSEVIVVSGGVSIGSGDRIKLGKTILFIE